MILGFVKNEDIDRLKKYILRLLIYVFFATGFYKIINFVYYILAPKARLTINNELEKRINDKLRRIGHKDNKQLN